MRATVSKQNYQACRRHYVGQYMRDGVLMADAKEAVLTSANAAGFIHELPPNVTCYFYARVSPTV